MYQLKSSLIRLYAGMTTLVSSSTWRCYHNGLSDAACNLKEGTDNTKWLHISARTTNCSRFPHFLNSEENYISTSSNLALDATFLQYCGLRGTAICHIVHFTRLPNNRPFVSPSLAFSKIEVLTSLASPRPVPPLSHICTSSSQSSEAHRLPTS